MATASPGSLTDRMKGAAMLDVATYEEVERDEGATGQAATVVAIVAVASAIGAAGSGGGAIIGGLIAAVICLVLIVLLYRMRKGAIARALFAGALWFTIALTLLAIVAVFGWEAFFAGFHQVFFADGTWTFYQTDSLIRLYPGQFWIDAAAWIAGITLAVMIITMMLTAPTGRRRYRNEQAQRFLESQVLGDGSTARTQP